MSDGARDTRRPVELDQQMVGRLSRMDALQGQAMAQGVEEAKSRFCEDCGDFIGFARLDADPCVMRCVSCAR